MNRSPVYNEKRKWWQLWKPRWIPEPAEPTKLKLYEHKYETTVPLGYLQSDEEPDEDKSTLIEPMDAEQLAKMNEMDRLKAINPDMFDKNEM